MSGANIRGVLGMQLCIRIKINSSVHTNNRIFTNQHVDNILVMHKKYAYSDNDLVIQQKLYIQW